MSGPQAIVLDVEGTTTPVSFVYETLFPHARAQLSAFVRERWDVLGDDVAQVVVDRASEADDAPSVGATPSPGEVVAFLEWLMDRDRKATGLKAIQGKLWEAGYREGVLEGEVFADVPEALRRWRAEGRRVAIYSSGSVLAQRLLFGHSTAGDLTPWIEAHFDTTTGPKREAASYAAIARSLGVSPSEVLFVSDVVAELDAAQAAGLQTLLRVEPGAAAQETEHPVVTSFDEVP